MKLLQTLADYAKDICSIATCVVLLVKPIRDHLLGMEEIREGQRCLLRDKIVQIYYRHHDDKRLREYEYKNLVQCYEGYKALKGNSFIDHIYAEMQEWDIT